MMEEGEAELVAALTADLGRPRVEAYAADIGHTKAELSTCAKHVARVGQAQAGANAPVTAIPARARDHPRAARRGAGHRPVELPDPAAARARWSAALAAGNCVVAKPSELAPACSAALARLRPALPRPRRASPSSRAASTRPPRCSTQRCDHIFFTGSTAVGRVVTEAAAKHLTPVDARARRQVPDHRRTPTPTSTSPPAGSCGASSSTPAQTCIAPDYVLVDASVRTGSSTSSPAP